MTPMRVPMPPMPRLAELVVYGEILPAPSDPAGQAVREFLANNWREAQEGLLRRTDILRLEPLTDGPRAFAFEIDRPYKRVHPSGTVELDPGPIHGWVAYSPAILDPPSELRPIVAFIGSPGFLHGNVSRSHALICLGDLPRGPFPLDALATHLYTILTYENIDLVNVLDPDAGRYFATDPHAFEDVPPARPLY